MKTQFGIAIFAVALSLAAAETELPAAYRKKWKGELNGKCVSIDATELVGAGTPVTVCHGTDCFTADASSVEESTEYENWYSIGFDGECTVWINEPDSEIWTTETRDDCSGNHDDIPATEGETCADSAMHVAVVGNILGMLALALLNGFSFKRI